MVSIIIPAFNEEKTLPQVLREVSGHPKVREIIVVDDGSTDDTAGIARAFVNVRLIRLEENGGKADAMNVGVEAAQSDIVFFIDADVLGFDHAKMSGIMDPVLNDRHEMFVGINDRKIFEYNRLFRIFPIISGERVMTKALWNSVPKNQKKGFRIEIALNYAAKQTEKGMGHMRITGMTHVTKEKKYGFWIGFWRRILMSFDIAIVSVYLYFFITTKNALKSLAGSILGFIGLGGIGGMNREKGIPKI
jgi:glycosyltransferase involved in cell wall biosynthesis